MRCPAFVAATLCAGLGAQGSTIAFEPPGPLIAGDPVRIVATAPAGARVRLELRLLDVYGRTWRSVSRFVTPADGRLDLARDEPLAGSGYKGTDALGPFWSLRLQRDVESVSPLADGRAEELTAELWVDGDVASSVRLRRWLQGPGVELLDLEDDRLVGKLALPNGDGPHPAVVVVGDSNGDLRGQLQFARQLGSRGYAALALAYFGLEGLPSDLQDVPLEYLERAVDWLTARPEVDAKRIAVLGGSKGGELALLMASRDPRLRAVVAFAPSSVVFQGIPSRPATSSWSVGGEALPFVGYAADSRFSQSGLLVDLYGASLDQKPLRELEVATIPVERIKGPVMLVSGRRDNMWPSSRMARDVMARLEQNGHLFETLHLDFENAGHEVGGPGYGPASAARSMGGTPAGKARALAEAWPRTLDFLARHLGRGGDQRR